MTRIVIKKLVWDEFNLKHIKKHKVSVDEALDAGQSLVYHKRTYKERYLAIGRSSKRMLTLVLNRISIGTYYPITIRDSSKKERKVIHEKEKKQAA